jgi:hypothetical protein
MLLSGLVCMAIWCCAEMLHSAGFDAFTKYMCPGWCDIDPLEMLC